MSHLLFSHCPQEHPLTDLTRATPPTSMVERAWIHPTLLILQWLNMLSVLLEQSALGSSWHVPAVGRYIFTD